jgi:hypothetical protein
MQALLPSESSVQHSESVQSMALMHRFAQSFWTVSSTQTALVSHVGGQLAPAPTPGVRGENGVMNPVVPPMIPDVEPPEEELDDVEPELDEAEPTGK